MTLQNARSYLLSKKGAEESYPFKMGVPVFKVGGKMFALINVDEERKSLNLKYKTNDIEALRASMEGVEPGYHMNKRHWNTVYLDKLNDKLLMGLIDISYDLVFSSLPKSKQKVISEQ